MTLNEHDVLKILMKGRARIAATAWLVVRSSQTAEDIFQNVVVKAMTKDTRFETEIAVMSWAMVTARREAIDWARRQTGHVPLLDEQILDLLQEDWQGNQDDSRVDALRECLRQLPAKSRELLRLRYYEDHSCGKVAEQLGVGLDAIYKRLSRLHLALRDCVEVRLVQTEVGEP